MPDYPSTGTPFQSASISIGVIDAAAKTAPIPFAVSPAAVADTDFNDALIADLRAAVGDLTNAAVFKVERAVNEELSTAFVVPLDEAHSSVINRLNLNFGNSEGFQELVSIPAPDLSYFTAGGGAMIRPDSTAIVGTATPAQVLYRSITRIIAFLNVSRQPAAPDWRLMNAYESARGKKRGKPSSGRVVYAEEPLTTTLPSGAPDTLATGGQQ